MFKFFCSNLYEKRSDFSNEQKNNFAKNDIILADNNSNGVR